MRAHKVRTTVSVERYYINDENKKVILSSQSVDAPDPRAVRYALVGDILTKELEAA